MDGRDDLGEFLRTRRARLRPEDVGLTTFGARRRVPGLRREELAQLAGVSAAYYTRLEQGQSRNASDGVLDALARVLRLTDDEHNHMRNLARPDRTSPRPAPCSERLRPATRRLVDKIDAPAILVGRFGDILAWNRLGHALNAGHLDFDAPNDPARRPNCARLVFLDRTTRTLYPDWPVKASENVAYLRVAAGRYRDHPALAALVGELSLKSPEFAAMWAAHPVREKRHGVRPMNHPLVGPLSLEYEVMQVPDQDLVLTMFIAEPGTASSDALDLLASLTLTAEPVRPRQAPDAAPAAVTEPAPSGRSAAPGRPGPSAASDRSAPDQA
ncbi:helix-turn-helix domain-containing protein [Yinghuangia soli]|uniref:Helix-turn-helix transcriptional regulator n=1 Tax=Yinghuangia soli TaxID=2908204 RepID=A0AA41U1N5_9ACTN|nr:helix-turn-helix transcriptional regulator [Yinghuangia soli]MCF2527747.1 helix-turn-helix transcriptional regulator [Yinghuangia soli]